MGPPTHPNELALDAEIRGEREIDDGTGDMFMEDPSLTREPEFEEPELVEDLGPVRRVLEDGASRDGAPSFKKYKDHRWG